MVQSGQEPRASWTGRGKVKTAKETETVKHESPQQSRGREKFEVESLREREDQCWLWMTRLNGGERALRKDHPIRRTSTAVGWDPAEGEDAVN